MGEWTNAQPLTHVEREEDADSMLAEKREYEMPFTEWLLVNFWTKEVSVGTCRIYQLVALMIAFVRTLLIVSTSFLTS